MKRLLLGAALAVVLTSCAEPARDVEPESELLVSAAASLADAFAELAGEFELANPGVMVVLNLAGSATLRHQIIEGAPVDVFASANISNMEQVVEAGEAEEFQVFVTNRLQIAVPEGNPAGVTGLEDFADDSIWIGLCAQGVPCGDLAREVLARAGVAAAVDSDEPDVRALLTKIELGELDAGITYASDVLSADEAVWGIEIPDEVNVVARYPIATLANAPNPAQAAAFVAFVLSAQGQSILAHHGFGPP